MKLKCLVYETNFELIVFKFKKICCRLFFCNKVTENFMLKQCQNKEPHQVFEERQIEELKTILKYGNTSEAPD